MSNTIDQRVVEMKFDNKNFESNVQTSLSTLDKLKQSLKLTEASKGLDNVSAAAKGIDLSGLGTAVETVKTKFSALQVIGVTALTNITNSALNAGKKIVSALTIDPIKTGLQEYETQINAVQTILANTSHNGTTIDEVNDALDELNKYADLTIYNFTEMTRNIGTFTAAGLDLDTSVKGIQGIANLAAVSGSTSQQASTAMYQLSQALAAGKVGLQDWNSVVNAGMGGKIFQDALVRTAKDFGNSKAFDALESGETFRNLLNPKNYGDWLTSDVLASTLSKFTKTGAVEYLADLYSISGDSITELQKLGDTTGYNTDEFNQLALSLANGNSETAKYITDVLTMADTATRAATEVKTLSQLWDTLKETAQSGWTQTWELIFGDFNEAKTLFSEIYNTISPILEASANARNELLQGWKDAGGRDDLIQGFRNIFEAIKSIVEPLKQAFKNVFPPTTSEQLVKLTEGFKNLTEKFILSEETSNKLMLTFSGLLGIFDIIRYALSSVFTAISPLLGGLDDLGGGILGVTAKIGRWILDLETVMYENDVFGESCRIIAQIIKTVAQGFKEFISIIKEKVAAPGLEVLESILDRIKERMSGIGDAADWMRSGVILAIDAMALALEKSDFLGLMNSIWTGIKTLGSGLAKVFSALGKGLGNIFGVSDFNQFFDLINTIIAGGVGVGIVKFLKSLTGTFDSLKDITSGIVDVFDGVRGCFEAYQTQLKADTLWKIAKAIALLVAAIVVVSLIDSEKLNGAVGAITMLFADLMASMGLLSKMSGGLTGTLKACSAMISMSVAVLVLAVALKQIADIDTGDLVKGLIGIAVLTAIVVKAAQVLGSSGGAVIKGAGQMVIFAAAIKILASACSDLATLSWNELAKGLVGVGVLMAEISLFLNTAKFSNKSILTAVGIVILSAAIKVLASACETFGQMKWGEIGKGLAAIGGLLAELALFTRLTGNAQHVISTGIALIAISAAMKILASALKDLGAMTWDELLKGLGGMVGGLIAITAAVNLMPKNMISIGAGLVIVSSALLILASALGKMGGMTWDELARGLGALSGSMIILVAALNLMTGTLSGSAALLVASVALLALAPALKMLGDMSWESIVKGLIALAGAFVVMGVAGLVLAPLVPTILKLAGAFALIGVGVLAIGAGLLVVGAGFSALAVGITALAVASTAGVTAIMAAISTIVTGLIGLIPAIIEQIGIAIVSFCKVIADGAPAIAEAVKAIVLSLIDVLVECVPAIANGALALIAGVLDALVTYTPQIVDSIFQFLIKLIDGIAARLPELIKSAINLLMQFFAGIVEALQGIDVETLLKGIVGIGLLAGIMAALSAIASLVPGAMVGVLGMGAVVAEMAIVLAAIGALAQIPGLDWLINEGGDLLQSIGNAIGKFVGGIAGGVAEGFTSSLPQIGSDLSDFMTNVTPFIESARNIDSSVFEGVKALADIILMLTAANIIEGLTSWFTGGSSLSKFGEQLPELGSNLNKFASNLGTFGYDQLNTLTCATNAIKAMAEAADAIPNEGGWVAKLVGENSLATFGSYLPELGTNLRSFAENLGTFGDDQINTVSCAANAVKAMAEAADAIPNEGGWIAKLIGDNSIATFGSNLPILGTNLKDFAANLGTFGDDQIKTVGCAANAIKEMSIAAKGIDGQAGWAKKLFGDNSMSTFSSDFPTLGSNLNSFVTNLGTFGDAQISTVSSAVKAVNALAALADSDLKGAKNNLGGFGDKVVELAEDISSFVKNMPSSDKLSSAISNVDKILKMIKDIAGADANIAKNFTESLGKIGKSGVKAFVDAFTSSSAKSDVKKAAINLIDGLTEGVKSKDSDVKKAFKKTAESGLSGAKDTYDDFYSAGKYLVTGFAAGISDNSYTAEAKAKAMAKSAKKAAEKALGINSPSKVFYKIGDYTGQGFIKGLSEYESRAYGVSSEVADSARKGLRDSISRIQDIINGNIDTQPTIRPVLDLSDLRSGASSIGSIFNSRSSVGVLANVGSISSTMNSRNQNGRSSEVVSAIEQLRKDLGNKAGNVYNIDGVTYDDGSNISEAVKALVRAARVERRR